uniref:Uncharacterized protein n=1 Tax=Myoviridae sp. ctKkB1 TaxID=2825081 RepID=A0A8S5V4R2_9CAUD|nr:MAG TPA: hypothetical protein [Myoviridae sp. ctKkB1]
MPFYCPFYYLDKLIAFDKIKLREKILKNF